MKPSIYKLKRTDIDYLVLGTDGLWGHNSETKIDQTIEFFDKIIE